MTQPPFIKADHNSDIACFPAIKGLIELRIRMGKGHAPISLFLSEQSVNEIILQLSNAKKLARQEHS